MKYTFDGLDFEIGQFDSTALLLNDNSLTKHQIREASKKLKEEFSQLTKFEVENGSSFSLQDFEESEDEPNEDIHKPMLGIDYGTSQIGFAIVSDDSEFSLPLCSIKTNSRKDSVKKIIDIYLQYRCNSIVIGYPYTQTETLTAIQLEISMLIKLLRRRLFVPIFKIDESNTSYDATQMLRYKSYNKKAIDEYSAKLILDRFISEYKNAKLQKPKDNE